MNPYPNGLPDSVAQMQAKSYADLFSLFIKYKKEYQPGYILGC